MPLSFAEWSSSIKSVLTLRMVIPIVPKVLSCNKQELFATFTCSETNYSAFLFMLVFELCVEEIQVKISLVE